MSRWGLTDKGFLRPAYNDLLDAYEQQARQAFGERISLTSRSILGLLLRIMAWFGARIWQVAEDVYNSGYIDTAAGVSLARLGAIIGIRPLIAQKAIGHIAITGDPQASIPAGLIVAAGNGQRFVTLETIELDAQGAGTMRIQAYVAGPDGNVGAGVIVQIVTPMAPLIGVVNPAPTSGGRERETDAQFRMRYRASTDIAGGSNADSIRAELLRTAAVAAAAVFENDTDEINADGLPPHSIECIVYGGFDIDVARAIHARKAAGIRTHGERDVILKDASGADRAIRFSRPAPHPIWVRVSDLTVREGAQAAQVSQAVRASLIAYIGSDDVAQLSSGLALGEDVLYNRLVCPINETSGVLDYTLEISADGVQWGRDNISIGPRAKAVTSPDRVVIS